MVHRRVPRTLIRSTLAAVLVLSGCMVGPDYRKPETATPANWKNVPQAQGQAAIDSRWWLVYADPTLNMLEDQAAKASPQLAAAVARVLQARAIARITDADLYPDVTFNPSASRSRQSGNRPIQPGFPVVPFVANDFRVPLDVSYEVDLWGKIRRASESAKAQAQAAANACQWPFRRTDKAVPVAGGGGGRAGVPAAPVDSNQS